MPVAEYDYICYEYKDFTLLEIKVSKEQIADLAIPVSYLSTYANFIFELKPSLLMSNDNNSFIGHFANGDEVFRLSAISNHILKKWVSREKFIFKFYRKDISFELNDNTDIFNQLKIIGILSFN